MRSCRCPVPGNYRHTYAPASHPSVRKSGGYQSILMMGLTLDSQTKCRHVLGGREWEAESFGTTRTEENGGRKKHGQPGYLFVVVTVTRKSTILPPKGGPDSSVDRAPDSSSKGHGCDSQQDWRENFHLQSSLSAVTPPIRCSFNPRVTAVARKLLRPFCQNADDTPTHAYTFD